MPRDVPLAMAARRLHLTLAQFDLVKNALYDRGFPRPDPTTAMFDLEAINAWMDRRSHLTAPGGLTPQRSASNAQEVYGDRARRLLNG